MSLAEARSDVRDARVTLLLAGLCLGIVAGAATLSVAASDPVLLPLLVPSVVRAGVLTTLLFFLWLTSRWVPGRAFIAALAVLAAGVAWGLWTFVTRKHEPYAVVGFVPVVVAGGMGLPLVWGLRGLLRLRRAQGGTSSGGLP